MSHFIMNTTNRQVGIEQSNIDGDGELFTSLEFCCSNTLTCFGPGCSDGALDVPKDGVDGDGVLGACVEALDHVEVVRVSQVHTLYVSIRPCREKHTFGPFYQKEI